MKRLWILAIVMGLVGCSRPSAEKSYKLVGVVKKVDAESGKVTILHEEIPGFMHAMTMPFQVKEKASLDDVREGDEIEAVLKIHADRSELEDLTVTKMAPSPVVKLDLDPGQPLVRPAVSRLEPGQPVPDFAITDQDGKVVKLSDLRGKVVILTFVYTRCPLPEFCPRIDTKFNELAQLVAQVKDRIDRVRMLSISFDPEHDTPEILKSHAQLRGAKPPLWRFAVASHEELRKVAEPLGLMYGPRPNEIVHNLSTAVIGPDGRLVRLISGGDWKPSGVLQTVREILSK